MTGSRGEGACVMTTKITAAGVMPAVLVVRPTPARERTVRARPAAEPPPSPESERPDPPTGPRTTLCRCGHDTEAHEHFRSGSDCGACGAAKCARFRAQGRRRWSVWRRRRT